MKGKTVLVIEDDAKILKLIRLYLENEGYQVFEAKDGMEGKDDRRAEEHDRLRGIPVAYLAID